MRVRIHRGTQEIGGSCVEVEADDGGRVVLDLGRPLNAGWAEPVELPVVEAIKHAGGWGHFKPSQWGHI